MPNVTSLARRYAPVALLGLLVGIIAVLAAVRQPLWYDELFTFHIASLTNPPAVLQALLTGADIHPPLDYIVRHISLKTFGESALARAERTSSAKRPCGSRTRYLR